jgi:hypothetical protein
MDNVWMHHHHHHQHIMIIVIANIGLSDKEWMMDNPMRILSSSCHLVTFPHCSKGETSPKGECEVYQQMEIMQMTNKYICKCK